MGQFSQLLCFELGLAFAFASEGHVVVLFIRHSFFTTVCGKLLLWGGFA